MANGRLQALKDAGMHFDDPPNDKVIARIDALTDDEFASLLATTSRLSTPQTGPTLEYLNGGFQVRSGGE